MSWNGIFKFSTMLFIVKESAINESCNSSAAEMDNFRGFYFQSNDLCILAKIYLQFHSSPFCNVMCSSEITLHKVGQSERLVKLTWFLRYLWSAPNFSAHQNVDLKLLMISHLQIPMPYTDSIFQTEISGVFVVSKNPNPTFSVTKAYLSHASHGASWRHVKKRWDEKRERGSLGRNYYRFLLKVRAYQTLRDCLREVY